MNQSWIEVLSYDDHISMVQVRKASIDTLSCCWRISIIPTNPSLYWNIELKWSHLNDSDQSNLAWNIEWTLSHLNDLDQQSLNWNIALTLPHLNDSCQPILKCHIDWNKHISMVQINQTWIEVNWHISMIQINQPWIEILSWG